MIITKDVTFNSQGDLQSQVTRLDANMTKLFQLAQGRIRFGDGTDGAFSENLSGQFQVFTTSGTPDAENTIAHTLGSVPTGYIVLKQDKAGSLYLGTTSWTSSNVYLKSNIASVAFTILLLK